MAHMFSSSSESWDREMCELRGLGISRVTEWHICSALQANRLKNTHMQTIIGEFL